MSHFQDVDLEELYFFYAIIMIIFLWLCFLVIGGKQAKRGGKDRKQRANELLLARISKFEEFQTLAQALRNLDGETECLHESIDLLKNYVSKTYPPAFQEIFKRKIQF